MNQLRKQPVLMLLLSIVILGLFLRVFRLSDVSMYGDELTMVYDSYSILKTGHDQTGAFLPITFSMGAGRPAGYVYGSIPFTALFGPTQFGVRLLSVFSGLGIIVLMFLLGRMFFSSAHGVVFALLSAISPWDLSLSRGGFEAHFALFLTLLGVYLIFIAVRKSWFFVLAACCFGLAIHTYPTFKVTLPLLIPMVFVLGPKIRLKSRYLLISCFVLLGFVVLAINQTLTYKSEERFASINIFSQEQVRGILTQKINHERSVDILPGSLSGVFHNKPVEYFSIFAENYLKNLSVEYLLSRGDGNPRHNMTESGVVYSAELVSILIGVFGLAKLNKKLFLLVLVWLLIAPIPTAIVGEPHSLRNSLMLPPLIIFSGNGLFYLWQKGGNLSRSVAVSLLIAILIQFAFIYERMIFVSPNKLSRFWSGPAYEISAVTIQNRDRYQYIILSTTIDNIEFAYPVYAKVEPNVVIDQNKMKTILSGKEFKKFENVYIGTVPEKEVGDFLKNLNGEVLYITAGTLKDRMFNPEVVVGKDRTVSFSIIRT